MNISELLTEARKQQVFKRQELLPSQDTADFNQQQKEIVQLANTIKTQCSDFLNEMKAANKFMYRGRSNSSLTAFRSTTPKNRYTKDSDQAETKKFNELLTSLGLSANRSNSIFVTSDKKHAQHYGNLYMIFPKNTAQYTWSSEFKDLIVREDQLARFKQFPVDQAQLIDELEKFENWFLDNRTSMTNKQIDLTLAYISLLNQLHRGMVLGVEDNLRLNKKQAQLISTHYPNSPLAPHLDQYTGRKPVPYNLTQFQKRYKMKNTDLKQALKKGHEVMITGEYYAINYAFLNKKGSIGSQLKELIFD